MARALGETAPLLVYRHGRFYRRSARRICRFGHGTAGAGFFVGKQSGAGVCGTHGGGDNNADGFFDCDERRRRLPQKKMGI